MKGIILASASPRRLEIFRLCGIEPRVVKSNIEETIEFGEKPEQIAMSLSFKKALDVAERIDTGLVIGADTIVVIGNTILGKPESELHARQMLEMLSGKSHRVITGFAIIDPENKIKVIDYETSDVIFNKLSQSEIDSYIKSREYLDKAGSYAIQGKGALLVSKIEGCYFNIVGLPISKINYNLKLYFNHNLL
ncbi:MAG: Maf family protein [Gudongella sp.]|nr:Maf family protein [Gudongella sp.]